MPNHERQIKLCMVKRDPVAECEQRFDLATWNEYTNSWDFLTAFGAAVLANLQAIGWADPNFEIIPTVVIETCE